ncbi:hypothetical protein Mal64_22700 [Pseudobythopirellula maris]|uniref:PH domain-containing protein n=1 Tax=Pseudobythopirellula maris TaxID=2527991 RepID=A0A5C5ZMT7_9BACT|nr:hypothetical protein [Pseudobythopirellula maris]TWT88782.1 hypothetical protein Mal64_22700 [Pseudobythopirellula maris]
MKLDKPRSISWYEPRWAYMPRLIERVKFDFTPRRLLQPTVCVTPLLLWAALADQQFGAADLFVVLVGVPVLGAALHNSAAMLWAPVIVFYELCPPKIRVDLENGTIRRGFGPRLDIDRARILYYNSGSMARIRVFSGECQELYAAPTYPCCMDLVLFLQCEMEVWHTDTRERVKIPLKNVYDYNIGVEEEICTSVDEVWISWKRPRWLKLRQLRRLPSRLIEIAREILSGRNVGVTALCLLGLLCTQAAIEGDLTLDGWQRRLCVYILLSMISAPFLLLFICLYSMAVIAPFAILMMGLLSRREATVSKLFGVEVANKTRYEFEEIGVSRIVIFSKERMRVRFIPYSGSGGVTAWLPSDIDMDRLIRILPGEVQVWDATKKGRVVARQDPNGIYWS